MEVIIDGVKYIPEKQLARPIAETFDFDDGNGPVPAHRHSNGRGWVADTATVSPDAYVGPNAWVFGNARVSGRVFGYARVYA